MVSGISDGTDHVVNIDVEAEPVPKRNTPEVECSDMLVLGNTGAIEATPANQIDEECETDVDSDDAWRIARYGVIDESRCTRRGWGTPINGRPAEH